MEKEVDYLRHVAIAVVGLRKQAVRNIYLDAELSRFDLYELIQFSCGVLPAPSHALCRSLRRAAQIIHSEYLSELLPIETTNHKEITMLILSRKLGEKIVLGDDGEITITVLSIVGNQVQLGIEAPDDVPVDRIEIFFKKLAKAQLYKQLKRDENE